MRSPGKRERASSWPPLILPLLLLRHHPVTTAARTGVVSRDHLPGPKSTTIVKQVREFPALTGRSGTQRARACFGEHLIRRSMEQVRPVRQNPQLQGDPGGPTSISCTAPPPVTSTSGPPSAFVAHDQRKRDVAVLADCVTHGRWEGGRCPPRGLGNAAGEVALAATPLNLLRAKQKEDGRREPRTEGVRFPA